MNIRTILVPVDFEEASEKALAAAAELAKTFGAKLVIVHAYELPFYPYPGIAAPTAANDLPRTIRDAATAGLEGLVARVKEQAPTVEALLRMGPAADEILAAAHEKKADLIVMGTHGRKGVAHALLGSIAEKIVRRSDVPVWTTRA
jgi:nucleotide-binding universal stress UspA family protein